MKDFWQTKSDIKKRGAQFTIAEFFTKTLIGALHGRIKYADTDGKRTKDIYTEKGETKNIGTTDKKDSTTDP